MTCHGAAGEAVPVVQGPAKFMDRGRHEQRRVRKAPRDDQVGLAGQGGKHVLDTEIGVCADDAQSHVPDRPVDFRQVGVRRQAVGDLVAQDECDLEPGDSQVPRDAAGLFRCRHRVRRPHVGEDASPAAPANRQQRPQPRLEVPVETGCRVEHAVAVALGEGPFAHALQRQIADPATFGERTSRVEPIRGEPRATTYDNRWLHVIDLAASPCYGRDIFRLPMRHMATPLGGRLGN